MAQLQLFPPTPAHRHATPAQAGDPADHRCRAYDVPIYRVTLVRECSITTPAPRLRGAQQAAALLRQYLGAVDREHFVVILLDRKHTPIGINTVSMGSLTASVVCYNLSRRRSRTQGDPRWPLRLPPTTHSSCNLSPRCSSARWAV